MHTEHRSAHSFAAPREGALPLSKPRRPRASRGAVQGFALDVARSFAASPTAMHTDLAGHASPRPAKGLRPFRNPAGLALRARRSRASPWTWLAASLRVRPQCTPTLPATLRRAPRRGSAPFETPPASRFARGGPGLRPGRGSQLRCESDRNAHRPCRPRFAAPREGAPPLSPTLAGMGPPALRLRSGEPSRFARGGPGLRPGRGSQLRCEKVRASEGGYVVGASSSATTARICSTKCSVE